jgi:2-polyprenyl-3-methyl-5-hydroxy-6-metoxy-1,4-benzoquinol methylase
MIDDKFCGVFEIIEPKKNRDEWVYDTTEKVLKMVHGSKMTPGDWKKEYQRGTAHWAEELDPSLYSQEFVDWIKGDKYSNILEIGCGNGRDSIYFARAGYQVTAVDVVPEAISLARTNISEAKVQVKTEVANVEKLPFEDESFDAIFCLSVLHSTNLSKSLTEIYRVLRPKCKAFIHIYANTILANGRIETNVTVNDFIELLKLAGFSIDTFYSEEEEEADERGERHLICVTQVRKS